MSDLILNKNLYRISNFKNIPFNWVVKNVGSICSIGRGRVISQDEIREHQGVYPVYSSQTSNNGEMGRIATFDYDGEWVTWTTDGANAGTVFYRNGKFNCTNVCGTLMPLDSNSLSLKFLSYHLNQIAKNYVSYVGNPKLMNDVVSEIALILPPLPQQRKIAKILTTVDNLIEKTEALIAKYQSIKQGMMHDLFTRGVDAKGKLRPPQSVAPELYKQSELGWIPKEWEVKQLEELYGNPIRDFGSFSSTNLITFLESGIPFIKSEMIEAGHINWDSVMFISNKVHHLLNKSHVREGNILFSKIGSALGKGVVYDGSRGVCNSNAAVAKIDIDPIIAGRKFITHFLNHDIAKVQLRNMIVSLLPRINLGDLSRLLVPCPTIVEQQQIEQRLLASETAINTEKSCLSHLNSTKTALMQDLLTGEVQVTPDEIDKELAHA